MDTDTDAAVVEPVTIETEAISTELNEEQRNALTDDTVETEQAGQETEDEAPKQRQQKQKPPGVKAMPDGRYVVQRADGTRIELTEDEIKGLAQKRIAAATYKQREAERRADDYRARYEAAQQTQGAPEGQPAQPQNRPATDDPRPSWENGDWESMDQYQDALDAWRDRKAAREPLLTKEAYEAWRASEDAFQRQDPSQNGDEPNMAPNEVWLSEAQRILAEGAEAYGDDWQTYVVANEAAPFDQEFTQFLFTEVDNPAAMLLELGRDTEKAIEIRQMLDEGKTVKAARALGKVEARIGSTGPTTDDDGPHSDVIDGEQTGDDDDIGRRLEVARARKASNTPPPIQPVSARSGISARKDPEKMTQAEYEVWRLEGGG